MIQESLQIYMFRPRPYLKSYPYQKPPRHVGDGDHERHQYNEKWISPQVVLLV